MKVAAIKCTVHLNWQKRHRQNQTRFPDIHKIKDTGRFEEILGTVISEKKDNI